MFLEPELRPNPEEEKLRYLHHENDVNDLGYQKFSSPITSAVLRDFTPSDKGLDFGAGTGPVIAKLLTDKQFNISLYDPFFHPEAELLEQRYDYIVCCEVIEHFYSPSKEFALLKRLLKPGGKLYCMTDLYHEEVKFKSWYYKNDPTHVFFYHLQSLEHIKNKFEFSKLSIEGRLITYSC